MSTMSILARTAIICTLASLTACGGGGDGGSSDNVDSRPSSLPADGQLQVLAGSSDVAAGTYRVTGGGGGADTFNGVTVGYTYVTTDKIELALAYPQGQSSKFILEATVLANDSYHACISAAWTDIEKQAIRQSLGGILPPTCPSNVTYNEGARLLTLAGLKLQEVTGSGKQLILSLNSTWQAPAFPISSAPAEAVANVASPDNGQ